MENEELVLQDVKKLNLWVSLHDITQAKDQSAELAAELEMAIADKASMK